MRGQIYSILRRVHSVGLEVVIKCRRFGCPKRWVRVHRLLFMGNEHEGLLLILRKMSIQNALYGNQIVYETYMWFLSEPQSSKNHGILLNFGRCQLKAKLFYSQTNLNCIVYLPNEHSQKVWFSKENISCSQTPVYGQWAWKIAVKL